MSDKGQYLNLFLLSHYIRASSSIQIDQLTHNSEITGVNRVNTKRTIVTLNKVTLSIQTVRGTNVVPYYHSEGVLGWPVY